MKLKLFLENIDEIYLNKSIYLKIILTSLLLTSVIEVDQMTKVIGDQY